MKPEDLLTPGKNVDDAVERLLAWNEQYRAQVESNAKRLYELGQLTARCTADYARVVEQSSALAKVARDVETAFGKLEAESDQLTAVCTDVSDILRSAFGTLPNVDKKVVGLVGLLARAIADHQRIVGGTLGENAVTIRNSLEAASEKLDEIAAAARKQVALLDDAMKGSTERSFSQVSRQISALSEAYAEPQHPSSGPMPAYERYGTA